MNVSDLVHQRLKHLLEEKRIVVWYDRQEVFASVLPRFDLPDVVRVDARASMLRARRAADAALTDLNNPQVPDKKGRHLLIYVPTARARTSETRRREPFEAFVRMGGAFGDNGDNEHESLQALARVAMPERGTDIDRLFREGRPNLALLDALQGATIAFPLLRQSLGVENVIDAGARILCHPESRQALTGTPGALEELLRLLERDLGYAPPRDWNIERLLADLGRYVLLSEFAFDLPGAVPATLASYPLAPEKFRDMIFRLCDRMRGSDDTREHYLELAIGIESSLRLPVVCASVPELGIRDTFPFEEKVYLQRLQACVEAFQLEPARAIVAQRRRSVWAQLGERAVLWKLAERCLELQTAMVEWRAVDPDNTADNTAQVKHFVQAYVDGEHGLWRVDRAQRLMEQGAATCAEDDELSTLVAFCRKRYFECVERTQHGFLDAVSREGWPTEGMLRQTQTFDRLVGAALQEGRKVVFFLVDAMRYEMGRDLSERLGERGACQLEAVTSALPTTTPVGMAALMPGADGRLCLLEKDGGLVPAIRGQLLPGSAERMHLLKARYGDRFVELTLDELLSSPLKMLVGRVSHADLLVVRTQDIDALGEGPSLHRARRIMTDVLGELNTATDRLAKLGFQRFVYAADHGHILLPELAPGEVVSEPSGRWLESKRRYRLGEHLTEAAGVAILKASHVGIQAPVAEIAVPRGFKTFTAGEGYFHEGISLQEALLPVVCLEVKALARTSGSLFELSVRYRSDRFTSRIIGLKIWYNSPTDKTRIIRLEAYDGSSAKALRVGDAADCDARDAVTGTVTLESSRETQVPLRVDESFEGTTLEIRATDPESGAVYDRLKLKNGIVF